MPGTDYVELRCRSAFSFLEGASNPEELADRAGARLRKSRARALTAGVLMNDKRVVLAFPQTFMNNSGDPVRRLVRRYGIDDLERLQQILERVPRVESLAEIDFDAVH